MAKQKTSAPTQGANPAAIQAESNRAMRARQHKDRVERKKANPPLVPRGTKRAERRAAAARSGITGVGFPEIWRKFCNTEKGIVG